MSLKAITTWCVSCEHPTCVQAKVNVRHVGLCMKRIKWITKRR